MQSAVPAAPSGDASGDPPTRHVVAASGDIDIATSPHLRDRLNAAVDDGFGDVVIDLRDIRFMDSTGIAVLLGANKQLRDGGRQLVLRDPSEPVRRVLEMLSLDTVLPIEVEE